MRNIRLTQTHKFSKKAEYMLWSFMGFFACIWIGVESGNIFLAVGAVIPGSFLAYLIYREYRIYIDHNECLNALRRKKVYIQKNIRLLDREILLLSKEGSIPEKGFKNLICMNLKRNEIYWMAPLVFIKNEKYDDFEWSENTLIAVTSQHFTATIDINTGELKHTKHQSLK